MTDQPPAAPGSYILSNSSCWTWRTQAAYLYIAMRVFHYDACRLAHRAFAALEAASLRCSSVILAARRLPPILPPLRPIWAMSCDTTDLVNFGSWEGSGVFPVSLF